VYHNYVESLSLISGLLMLVRGAKEHSNVVFSGYCGWRFSGQVGSPLRFLPRVVYVVCSSETSEQTKCAAQESERLTASPQVQLISTHVIPLRCL
jgi:hypothetical protein